MIVLLLGGAGLNRCQVILYAWSPLVLKEYGQHRALQPIALATLCVLVRAAPESCGASGAAAGSRSRPSVLGAERF